MNIAAAMLDGPRPSPRAGELFAAAQELRELATRLERLPVADGEEPAAAPAPAGTPGPALAAALYAARNARAAHLPGVSLGEPSWDMLLTLYVADARGRDVLVSEIYSASRAPTSTALRHLKRLRDKGYVELEVHDSDARKRLVRLSPAGLVRIERLLAAIAALFCGLDGKATSA